MKKRNPKVMSGDVYTDFEIYKLAKPSRCCLCELMQPIGGEMAWVSSSASYYKNIETYESLYNGSFGSTKSAACVKCITKIGLT